MAQLPSSPQKTPQSPFSPLSPFSGPGSPLVESSTAPTTYHYIIVRADLTVGQQAAQIVHAAGESAANRDVPPGTHAIVLHVQNEEDLLGIADRLWWKGIKDFKLIIEPDLPLYEDRPLQDGQGTAIGIPPTTDRKKLASVLGQLRLLR